MSGAVWTCRKGVLGSGMLVLALLLSGCAAVVGRAEVIYYRRSGGIAGFEESLVIREDRSATLVSLGQTWQFEVDAERFETLVGMFDAVNFLMLQEEFLPQSTCCDLFDYTIRYRDHTVHTMTTAIPAEIVPILDALDGLVSEHIVR